MRLHSRGACRCRSSWSNVRAFLSTPLFAEGISVIVLTLPALRDPLSLRPSELISTCRIFAMFSPDSDADFLVEFQVTVSLPIRLRLLRLVFVVPPDLIDGLTAPQTVKKQLLE